MNEVRFIADKLEGYNETEGFKVIEFRKKFGSEREYYLSVVPKNDKVDKKKCNLLWLCFALKGYEFDVYHFEIVEANIFDKNNWQLRIIEVINEEENQFSEE